MVRWIFLISVSAVLLELKVRAVGSWGVREVRPDWTLIWVVFLALSIRKEQAVLAAWLVGAACDCCSLERFGIHAIPYTVVAATIAATRDALFAKRALTRAVLTFVSAAFVESAWLGYRHIAYGLPSIFAGLLQTALPAALLTTAWSIPLQFLMHRLPLRRSIHASP